MTTLPRPPNSWRVEAGLTPIPYQDDITPQRCWVNPTGTDKDMCAASSLASQGRDSSSSLEEQRKVTPLDLQLTGDPRVSAIRYAPFTNSPARENIYGLPGSTGLQHSSSGLLPSQTSSPCSSTSYPERPSSTSLRQPSYGSFNLPPREIGSGYTGRLSSQAQLQWYQQQANDQSNSNEMVVGSYHDSRLRQQPH